MTYLGQMDYTHNFNPYNTRGMKRHSWRDKDSHQHVDKLDRIEHYRREEQDHGIKTVGDWKREWHRLTAITANRGLDFNEPTRQLKHHE
jgi:hypothetical protein